jgi:hypothetical protein
MPSQGRLKDPVGALKLPGAASPAPGMPPDVTLVLPALLPPPLMLSSVVVLRELDFETAPGLSIQSRISLCEFDAMPTSSTR